MKRKTTYYGWGGHIVDADHLNDIARKLETYVSVYTGDKEAREMAEWCKRAAHQIEERPWPRTR